MSTVVTGRRLLAVGAPFALILATVSFRLLRVRFSGSPDASFYLGHVVDLSGQAARFGQTYHGNRISYILVDRWFVTTFGLEPGLMLARHLVLAIAVLAAFALGARWAGLGVGVLAGASVAFVPWLPRELMWTFYDGFATTYLLAGTALLFVPSGRRSRAVGEVGAGILFAAAINANLALAVLVALTGLSWWVLRADEGLRLAASTARLVTGWLVASGSIALALRTVYPGGAAFPELVALRVGLDVLSTDQYFTPLRELGWRLGHLAPVVGIALALVVLLALRDRGDEEVRPLLLAAALQMGGVGAFALVLHLVTRDTWFGAPYYTIYHLPGAVLGLVAVLAAVTRRGGRPPAPALVGTAVVVLAGWYALLPLPAFGVRPVAALGVGAALVLPASAALVRRAARPALVGVSVVISLLASLGTTASGWHVGGAGAWDDIATRNAAELDLLRHSAALKDLVEANVATDERLQFWHTAVGRDGDVLRRLNMVFYGTGDGRVQAKGSSGMPQLGDAELAGLRADPPVVVMLGTSPAEVVAGDVALQLAGFQPVVRAEAALDGSIVDVSVRIVDLG